LTVDGGWVDGEQAHDEVLRLRTGEVTWQPLDGDVVVLDLRTSRYLRLNDTAALLWHRLEDGARREDLVEALLGAYDVDAATAAADVDRVLGVLDEQDLLEAVPQRVS
jgi:hypothetical protein